MQSFYLKAISSQLVDWWNTQSLLINQKIKTTSDNKEKFMLKRILNYLSLATYMNVISSLKTSNFVQAEKFNVIYSLVDPDNPEHFYLSAILMIKKGEWDKAIELLKNAAELGFSDTKRLESDTVMSVLYQKEKFQEVLKLITNNANKK